MSSNGNNQTSQQGAGDISRNEIDRYAQDAFRQSAQALNNADFDKTTKLFGLFEVPSGIAAMVTTGYNIGTKFLTDVCAPRIQTLVRHHGPKLGLQGNALTRAAAVATFSTGVALKSGAFFGNVWEAHTDRHKQFAKLAQTLTPVLDDLKGQHTVGALYAITEAQNEVIFSHRRRVGKIANARSWDSWISLGVNAGPNILMGSKEFAGMLKGEDLKEIRATANRKKHEAVVSGAVDHSTMGELQHYGSMFANFATANVAEYLRKLNNHKLNKELEPYSALEMILELEKQVAGKPDSRSFQMPKSFQNPKGHTESFPLEEYIVRILIQHQKDMAGISPDHTEIREALKDDLAAVAKPLAEAIRKGDMSALELVRLVGEGKIIKNRGRSIASAEEVEAAIKRDVPKHTTYTHVDPKVYWDKKAGFTKKEAKEALAGLAGEERQIFLSWMPHEIRKEIGVADAESKEVDAAMAKEYDRRIVDAVVGLNAETDEQLKKAGRAQKEIKDIRAAYSQIEKKGEKAVHDLKTSSTNDNGIEQMLTNWAVPQIVGDKTHFGTVLAQGHAKFETLATDAANDDEAPKDKPTHTQKVQSKHPHEQHSHGAKDHGESHADRAHESRMTGTHDRHA